ncbi:glyoxalase/bleomycin resistance/dioxygenase family protein [Corynebacterium breve]|uniref:Glyoxalase/bleomycin resistance/dioxygenase family protein n=1 Tax=Corynebacterium breve TaxID=3049799 RepID=A0ABY8VEU1_9CORY|nr:glyoxalase/bleomycin resistance/dioxygenase family protein [Corynebacterium breve]WIM68023.1 glyoxalase/bleomycin resistance/dioxygenase family protein [Corynebacterium breve]
MPKFNAVIPVLPVKELANVTEFYNALFGEPTMEPADGIAEWEVAPGAWVQVAEIPERAGQAAVVLGTDDLLGLVADLKSRGIGVSSVEDFGVVMIAVAVDPEGNELQLAEETE